MSHLLMWFVTDQDEESHDFTSDTTRWSEPEHRRSHTPDRTNQSRIPLNPARDHFSDQFSASTVTEFRLEFYQAAFIRQTLQLIPLLSPPGQVSSPRPSLCVLIKGAEDLAGRRDTPMWHRRPTFWSDREAALCWRIIVYRGAEGATLNEL